MTPNEIKAIESRLRRMAERRGHQICKSRVRDRNSPNFGGYMLVDAYSNTVVMGCRNHQYDADLDEIERHLHKLPLMSASR